ncbi:MAG: lysylphosphatidylglycerol synthase transmembrane domain-containing protein [Candidatus Micrarchaeia archaeon]
MKKSLLVQLLISLVAVALVLYLSDFPKVLEVMRNVNLVYFIGAAFLYLGLNSFMAYRITLILKEVKEKISFFEALEASLSGMLASDFTPARTGYFATAFLINKNSRIPMDKAMLSILAPQLFEFTLKFLAGSLALWYLLTMLAGKIGESIIGMVVGAFIFLSMIAFMGLLLFSKKFVEKLSFLSIFPYGKQIHSILSKMQKNSKSIRKLLPYILAISLTTWFIKSCEWVLLSKSIGMKIETALPEIVFFAFLHPLVTILQFIPAPTLAGMGLYEGGTAVVLSLFGVPPYQSVSFALLARFMNMAVDLLGVKGALKVAKKL